MILAFNVDPLQCADSFKLGLSKDISVSVKVCLIEARAVYTACLVVSHFVTKQKVKSGVKSRKDIRYLLA
jgi:hypothetical protein